MKPEYYIGIDMIDEEHKQLFKYADEAYELLHDEFTPDKYDRIDIILENLRNYTVKHFSDEEQYMESINYKKIFTQKVQHQEFIHKLDEFMEHHNDEVEDQDEQIMGILKYLTEWLVNHILYVDGQIPKGWYSKKGCYFLESSSLFLNIKYDTYTWQYAYIEEKHQVLAKRNFVLAVRGGIFGDKPTAYYDFGE